MMVFLTKRSVIIILDFYIAKNTLIMKSIHLNGIVRESPIRIFQVPDLLQQRFHEIQRHWKNNGIRFIRGNFCQSLQVA